MRGGKEHTIPQHRGRMHAWDEASWDYNKWQVPPTATAIFEGHSYRCAE
jgi:hypothetical protein